MMLLAVSTDGSTLLFKTPDSQQGVPGCPGHLGETVDASGGRGQATCPPAGWRPCRDRPPAQLQLGGRQGCSGQRSSGLQAPPT